MNGTVSNQIWPFINSCSSNNNVFLNFKIMAKCLIYYYSQEAEKSIRFYRNIRGNNVDCALIQSEIDKLKCIVGDMETRNSKENSMKWSDIITNPGRKSMIIGIFLATLNHFSGSFALISYTATIFENTGSFMSSNDSALVIGIIQFIGTVSVPFLVERTGRKVNPLY